MTESVARYQQNLATLCKLEPDYGVDAVPTGLADAIQMTDVTITPLDGGEEERGLLKPYMGHQGVILVQNHVSFKGSFELAGSGEAGVPPACAPVLRAMGFHETIVEEASVPVAVEYNVISSAFEAATWYYNLDGVLHAFFGSRGTMSFSLVPARIPRIAVEFKGLMGPISDAALPEADYIGFIDPVPVNKVNTTMSLHGWSAIAESLSIDLGATITPRMLIGEESVKYSGRKTVGTAVVQATSLATKNWFQIAQAHTKGSLHVQHGTVAGNIVEIDAPKVQIGRLAQGTTDGIANYSMPLMLTPDAGNDELVLTFR
ncbi:MAG TPA: hypothetical protein VL133_05205 [Devosia sp.]|nr:hypothetical protein [Devosia sp.]